MRYNSEWFVLAARAGFATPPYAVSSRGADADLGGGPTDTVVPAQANHHSVIVAAGGVFGDRVSARAASAACRLAKLADVDLLGLRLATAEDGVVWFEAADLYPDLRTAGDGLVDHLVGLVPCGPGG
jgi:hypothetical protein